MTKEEKIKELLEQINKEYHEVTGDTSIKTEDYKDEDWKSLRIECANSQDILSSFIWAQRNITDHFYEKFNRPGVFDVLFCVSYRGEFDHSDEAKKRRAIIKEKQQELQERAKKGLEDIEAEYASSEST